ncbi:AMP-binding protein [Flavimobilis sp. GY10621]|uniref:AMP-binding protein n=1 Tax=Flavimobilis rhizosphaerae TaxID=2775421 RepID=A0ABR9DTI4_9MICO|nr:AMP-binding protein [Flavimobilis rhizosphaerae]MBD9700388.1 AMP-binding protein [Flavimobilis rhizosphaerae]
MDLADRPWLSSYAPGVAADVDVPDEPLHAVIERNAAAFPDRIALDFLGRRTTYRQLATEVARAAGVLTRLGVAPGDRVAIALPNCPTHVVAFYAVLRVGGVVVECNPTYTRDELAHQIADSGAKVAIAWEPTAARLLTVQADAGVKSVVAVDLTRDLPGAKRLALKLPVATARALRSQMRGDVPDGTSRWEELLRDARPVPASYPSPEADDLALLQYTGGTTGTPKAAMLTHRNLVANALQGQEWTQLGRDEAEGPRRGLSDDVVYGVLPFFHAFGLTLCLSFALRIGATLVLLPKFDVEQFLAAQKRVPGTFLPAVPPMLDRIAKAAPAAGVDLTSFQFAICGAMPLPTAVASAWEAATGGLAIEGYGMTETSPVALGSPCSDARQPGTLGLPFPSTHIRVTDQEDPRVLVPAGERGELLISGPQVFQGYWNRPEETTDSLVEVDGRTWIRTGDVVVVQPDGFVKLVDRIKEMIISGGFKVYPSQVEDHLRAMPGIEDVAVVGVPGGDLGERVVAAIVLATDVAAAIDLEQVRAWGEEKLARYALPKQLEIVTELPRSQIGKVLRRVVRDDIMKRKPE